MQYGSPQEILGGQVYDLPNYPNCIFQKGIFCCWAGNKPTLPVTFLLTIGQTVKPEKFKSKVKNGDFLSKSKVSMTLFLIKSKLTIRKSAETKKFVIFLRKISLRKISFMKNPFKFEMAIISSGNNPVQESGNGFRKRHFHSVGSLYFESYIHIFHFHIEKKLVFLL